MNSLTNSWSKKGTQDYREQVSYDPNGNILTYKRNGDGSRSNSNGTGMGNLTYFYKPGTNQLHRVSDAATDALPEEYGHYNDLKQGQADSNYLYDKIGNLIKDSSENIVNIEWTVYGKIKKIHKKGGIAIVYSYDAAGNRTSKSAGGTTTYYVRDATGNVMSVYEKTDTLKQKEVHLYGSSRLGILQTDTDVQNCGTVSTEVTTFMRGLKLFELSNHLGNVLATVSDKKFGVDTNSDGVIDYYTADVVSANDYYPFGMMIPGRRYSAERYRYGFNGKELDKETAGTTTYDYGFRIYNPGLGRFLSMDPLTKEYPELTPYQFASNRPIDGIGLDGLEYISFHHYANGAVAKTEFYKMTDKDIKRFGGTTAGIHYSVPFGREGRGVKHIYYDEKGNVIKNYWEMRQTGGASDFKFHGLYSGPGSVTYGGFRNSENYDFTMQPIDWADAIAKRHDMDYAAVAGENYVGFLEDVRTVQAVRDMVARIDALAASFLNPFKSVGVEGVETPLRTSYSTEMDFTMLGQRIMIDALATYKQWKVDNNYTDLSTDGPHTYNKLRSEFFKAHPATAKILDQTQE